LYNLGAFTSRSLQYALSKYTKDYGKVLQDFEATVHLRKNSVPLVLVLHKSSAGLSKGWEKEN
jgi:hypothetical protein